MTLEFAGNMLCSAGVSYFHVYPNGDVYRCLADWQAHRPPMFNLKRDGWKGGVDPTLCDHERCSNACDLDWTTKWQVDGQGRLEKTFEGQRKDIEKEVSLFLCSQRLESPERRMAYFIWSPTLACNYTCAYCGCAAGEKQIRNDFPSSYPELSVDEWTDIWSDILERFEYGILSITGGEPLLSDATIPVLSVVTQKFACYITSNISRNIMEFTRGRIRPGAPGEVKGFGHVPIGLSGINCSLHPTSKGFNWELFKGSLLLLRNTGFHVSVNYVGYPLQLYLAPEYKAWCEQHKVEFTLSSWQGVDNEGTVARYSLPEQTFFEELAPSHRKIANELVFMDCRYDVMLDQPTTHVLMADVVTLTGRIRNLSPSVWQVGSGPGRWSVAGYLTRIGRRKVWVRELRTSPPDCRVPENGELEFALPIDTRGLPAGHLRGVDRHADGRPKLDGAPRGGSGRCHPPDRDVQSRDRGGRRRRDPVARRHGRLEWHGAQHLPQAVARGRGRRAAETRRPPVPAVRQGRAGSRIPCSLGRAAGNPGGRGRLPPGARSGRSAARRLRAQHRCGEGEPILAGREGDESQGHPGGDRMTDRA